MQEELSPPIEAEINQELTQRYSPPYCVIDNCLCELRMTKDNVSKKRMLRKKCAYMKRYKSNAKNIISSGSEANVNSAEYGEDVFCSEHRKCGATFPAARPNGRCCEGSALIPVTESEAICDA